MKSPEFYLQIIERCKTLKDIDRFIENAMNKEAEEVVLSAAYDKRLQLTIEDCRKSNRRPDLNYFEMGLKKGEVLKHMKSGQNATVFTDRTLSYNGREVYITPLQAELTEKYCPQGSGSHPTHHWELENGTVLNDLYVKTYGPKK